jgi:putative MATE family efflux protein
MYNTFRAEDEKLLCIFLLNGFCAECLKPLLSIHQHFIGKRCHTSFKKEEIKNPMFTRKQLVNLILPLAGEQLLAVTIGLSDTMMVANVGEAAVSGTSIIDAINVLLIQIFSALATGGAVVAAQYIGRGDKESGCTAAKQLLYAITFLAAMVMALCLAFRTQIIYLVYGDLDAEVMKNAQIYFFFTSLSYPFLAIYNAGAALFRAMGNSKISMMVSLIDNVVHIGTNAVLIFVCGFGAMGAGIGTLFARILAAIAMLILICRPVNTIYVDHPFRFCFLPDMVFRILHIGVPNGLENGMFQIGKLIVQRVVTTFGTSAIAANAVAGSISSVANIPGNACSLALITIVGQCLGAGDYDQAQYYTKRLMRTAYISMGTMNIMLLIASKAVVGVYSLDPVASATAIQILQLFAFCSATIWIPSFFLPNALRAAGDVRFTMLTSTISMWVFRIGFCFILTQVFHLGVQGVWGAMYIDWSVRMIVFTIRYRSGKWKTKKVI